MSWNLKKIALPAKQQESWDLAESCFAFNSGAASSGGGVKKNLLPGLYETAAVFLSHQSSVAKKSHTTSDGGVTSASAGVVV